MRMTICMVGPRGFSVLSSNRAVDVIVRLVVVGMDGWIEFVGNKFSFSCSLVLYRLWNVIDYALGDFGTWISVSFRDRGS